MYHKMENSVLHNFKRPDVGSYQKKYYTTVVVFHKRLHNMQWHLTLSFTILDLMQNL